MHEKHKVLVSRVCSLIETGKSAHAFLFTGPRGVGKRLLVESIIGELASHAQGNSTDDTLFSFSFATPHPDVLVIERASDAHALVLEDIQRAHQRLLHHPVQLRWNSVVVCNAQEMNTQSANAFLKLLEEPPQSALIFLTATATSSLLPTIVSRCHQIPVCSIPFRDLTHSLELEGISLERASWIATLSQGRYAFAQELVHNEVWEEYTSSVRAVLAIMSADLGQGFKTIEQFTQEKTEYQRMCDIVLSLMRDLMILKVSASIPLVHEWIAPELALMKDRFSLDRLVICMSALLREREYGSIALHRRLRLEDIFLSFHHTASL